MRKSVKTIALVIGLIAANTAAAGTHKFFLTCADKHKVFVNAKYGAIDPGKEAAKVSVGHKFAPFHGGSCSVSDYVGPQQCLNCEWEEFEAGTISGDELARLANGDVTVIPEIVIGVPAKTAENVVKEGDRFFKKVF